MIDTQQLANFKKQLLELRETLIEDNKRGDAATQIVELDQSSVGRLSRMDAMQGQAMAQENERRRANRLKSIQLALDRINNNCFGFCASCDEEIAKKRLSFDPTATLCIECATMDEK